MEKIVHQIEVSYFKQHIPKLDVGDSVKIGLLIQEGNKQRVQSSEGVIISKNNAQLNSTITVRRVFQGIGVEKFI